MANWQPTAALWRASVVGACGLTVAVLLGSPGMVVLAAPFVLFAAMGVRHRPNSRPTLTVSLGSGLLHEGETTSSRLSISDPVGVEQITRVNGACPYLSLHPSAGIVSRLDNEDVLVRARRWGRRTLAPEKVALTSPWAGWRWGPETMTHGTVEVLAGRSPFDAAAEMPHPLGLVGAHRSRRVGSGSEFAGIRGFQPGDPIKKINWRTSLRAQELQVQHARSEEDSAVLLVVDALADYGVSGGIDGAPSSVDQAVRAAGAIAQHFTRTGDRTGLRIVGSSVTSVAFGAGARHLRQLQMALSRTRPGRPSDWSSDHLRLRVSAGTTVVILSPFLDPAITTLAATLIRRGLPVIVLDTLPPDTQVAHRDGIRPQEADLAWRMRLIERGMLLANLTALGCPVVPWRGPGSLDDVLRRLARRAQLPQVARR